MWPHTEVDYYVAGLLCGAAIGALVVGLIWALVETARRP